MIQFKVDIVDQMRNLLPSSYEFVVLSVVMDELAKLKKESRGADKLAASVAYNIASKSPFVIKDIEKSNHVDNILLDYCKRDDVLCTNDRTLRKRARNKGISVIYLKQHRFLDVDGYIKY